MDLQSLAFIQFHELSSQTWVQRSVPVTFSGTLYESENLNGGVQIFQRLEIRTQPFK